MFTQKQVRDLHVIEALASETSAKAFIASASPLESKVLTGSGKEVPTAVGEFKVFTKHKDGFLKVSEVINPSKVTSLTKTVPKTAINKAHKLTFNSLPAVGTNVVIKFEFSNWGSRSFDDKQFMYAQYTVKKNDTIHDLINGLLANLNAVFSNQAPKPITTTTFDNYSFVQSVSGKTAAFALIAAGTAKAGDTVKVTGSGAGVYLLTNATGGNFDAAFTRLGDAGTFTYQDNPLFSFSKTQELGAKYSITITERPQEQIDIKKMGDHLVYKIYASPVDEITITNRVLNPGAGKFVRNLEVFTRGNTGDIYRSYGYPYTNETEYDSDKTKTYYIINMNYYSGDGDAGNVQKSPRELQLAVTDKSAANAIITALTTATGKTLTAFA